MRVPLNWLKDYVDVTLPPEELALRLTMAGLEVCEIDETGGSWTGIASAGAVYVSDYFIRQGISP